MSDVKLIVGLGNPGSKYDRTRHNAGFWVVDSLAEMLGVKLKKKKFGGLVGDGQFQGKKLILFKPMQYMNRSGQPVATVSGFYKLDISDVLVLVDDLALEPGRIRLRGKGSAGGQKGLHDILNKLGSNEVARLRVGIGQDERIPAESYVLAEPSGSEKRLLDDAVERARQAVFCWLEEGIEAAMNKFNQRLDDNKENE